MTARKLESSPAQPSDCTINARSPSSSLAGIVAQQQKQHKSKLAVPIKDNRPAAPVVATDINCSIRQDAWPKPMNATQTKASTSDQTLEEEKITQSDKNNNNNEDNNNTDKTRIDDDNNDAGDKCNKAASAPEKAELGPVQTEDSRRQIVQIASYTSQQQQQATLTSNQRQRPVQHHPNQHHSNPNQVQHQQHQPQQQIVPINLQTIVGPHHHQQSHFIQASPAAFPTARLVHHQQPLQVSWTCPVTDGSQVRDPQLYGALLHQHYPYATYHQQAASYPTIVQQQQPSTTTIASPTTGAAEFSPAPGPLGPMPAASYHPIPGPAFYTGHLYHQPQHQPVAVSLSHQHQHQLATLEQRAAAASRSGPQWQEVYGQLNDKLEPPPLVATRLADAADTGKVLGCNRLDKSTQHNDSSVDRRQLTSDTCGGGPIREHDEGATTPPPRNNSNGNSNNGTALDSGAILNRSPSQQQQQPRRLESSQDSATATTQSSGSSSLIVSADNEIKNDIITSEHNKRQPLNEPAIVASANAGFGNGNDDEDVGKHVKPSNQLEVALDRFKCQQSRAQGRPDSASVLAATTTTAADHLCQSSVDSQRINREEEENEEEDSCQQDCGIKISLIDTKDKPGGQKEGSNGLMVPVIKTSISESDQTINDTTNTSDICQALVVDVRVCPSGNKSHTGPGGVGGGEEGSIGIGNGNDQNQQEAIDLPPFGSVVAVVGPPSSKLSPCETQAGSADSKADEEAPQVAEAEGASTSTTSRARAAELNQISINGTTFYHVNPAIWRTLPATSTNGSSTTSPPPAPTLPPLPQPALISHHHHHQYMGYNQAAAYHHHQPMAFTTTQNGNSPPNIVPYFQPYHLHHHAQPPHQAPAAAAGGGHIVPIADYYYWPTTRHSTPLSAPYAFPFGLVHPAYSSPATQYYPHAADLGRNHQRPIATYHHGPAAGFRIYSNHHHHFSVPHDATSIALPVQVGTSSHHYGPLPSEPITTTAVIPSMAASVGMMQPDVHQLPATGATNTTATTITTTANTTATDVSQLKLGYNLIPLLPISAIPTRVRQAYGMDKVWQEEFEQLFAQFVSQVVWTLVEVETNPNIRNSSRILAYKGRYIVRVDGPPIGSDEVTVATAAADGSSGASMVSVQDGNQSEVDQHTSGEDEDDRDEGNDDDDNESSWTEEADDDDDDEQIRCSADDVEDNQTGNSGQGGRLGGSNCESDCDSGAVLNSTSSGSSSETASQDLSSHSELGANQESVTPTSPTPSPPLPQACQIISSAASNGAQQEPAIRHPSPAASSNAGSGGQDPSCPRSGIVGGGLGVDGRKLPLKFRMFIDSAKVRFCCDTCGHGWTSMKGRVVFWYELFELVDGPGHKNVEGVSNLIGYCAYKLFGQQCDICKIENRFERPMWYPEEVTKVLCNLFNKIGQVYFGLRMPTIDKQRRAGKPKTSHNSLLCQACHDGVCTDRK